MTFASMTGFARVEGGFADRDWHWEIRSVNGRGLDVRLRLPSGFERLEPPIRERVQKTLSRGSLTIGLQMRRSETSGALRVNEAALDAVIKLCDELTSSGRVAPPRADGLLAIKGVIEVDEETDDEASRAALDAALLQSFDEALGKLVDMRNSEGGRLKAILDLRLDEIETLTRRADANPSRSPAAIGKRLGEQVAQLMDAAPALDSQRLHQEAVLLATKADIREELDRLSAHVTGARELLNGKGAVGRKLEFLTQEFNREANTLCSKSNDVELTRIGLELKSVVDQMREQVQNVE
ncbi:YicC/YloC family endoribonuclease [Microbaculum marinum]|uniref:YicC/YloC family endoribonuclease n=1 Tax=Microbaculum marinum TaxID=1764581 RepID=A0AAW9S0K4_9HYPH